MESSERSQFICPGDKPSFDYWVTVMGTTPSKLNAAIIETGSVEADVLARHLSKGKPFFYIGMYVKAAWLGLKMKFFQESKTQYS